jgi:hypothetical protein
MPTMMERRMSEKIEETVKKLEKVRADGLRKGLQSASAVPDIPEPPTPQPRRIEHPKKE